MPEITVDGNRVSVPEGATILEAAAAIGKRIPTLCYMAGYPIRTSCMICVVKDLSTGELIPSCSRTATEGLALETRSDSVMEARRAALELLLSEHLGDCEAPCRRACPAFLDIPRMNRFLRAERLKDASLLAHRQTVLPAVIGRICPAPCEQVCRRREIDGAVSICSLERYAGDVAPPSEPASNTTSAQSSGRRIAVIGSGPAGLSAASHLRAERHSVTIIEKNREPGGALRYEIPEVRLPRPVLDAELAAIDGLGIEWQTGRPMESGYGPRELLSDFDAVVVATGTTSDGDCLPCSANEESEGIFRAGGTRRSKRRHMAARAVAEGRAAADLAIRHLDTTTEGCRGRTDGSGDPERRYDSRIGRMSSEESKVLLASSRGEANRSESDLMREPGQGEAGRCMECDCVRSLTCELRSLADQFQVDSGRIRGLRAEDRRPFRRRVAELGDSRLTLEQGKCIKCGKCVAVSERSGVPLGLTFRGRGYELTVDVPFGEDLAKGLGDTAADCAAVCPTGALWFGQRSGRGRQS